MTELSCFRFLFGTGFAHTYFVSHLARPFIIKGKPDQMTRILDDANEILYFTEEHGADNGVHARDAQGRYYTILEGLDYPDESAGLGKLPRYCVALII